MIVGTHRQWRRGDELVVEIPGVEVDLRVDLLFGKTFLFVKSPDDGNVQGILAVASDYWSCRPFLTYPGWVVRTRAIASILVDGDVHQNREIPVRDRSSLA